MKPPAIQAFFAKTLQTGMAGVVLEGTGLQPLISSLHAGSCHAAVSVHDLCRDPTTAREVVRIGGVPALTAMAGNVLDEKLRGWALSALALLARLDEPRVHQTLSAALPILVSTIRCAPLECRAWQPRH